MLEEATSLLELRVYTPWGVEIGGITNLEIDSELNEISNLVIEQTNEKIVEDGASIMIPYRWIMALGDIVILRHFPNDLPIKNTTELGVGEYKY
ncbi:MAG: PRC-barrel domain-containing protein [Candidatus Thermoplasmatota archaeon]|jgi:sporulation protein YlmC with PRC-barrel domain|nr:PRC-barrel domain-containing protein [Candidatus Thermoplasmatota archaeon]